MSLNLFISPAWCVTPSQLPSPSSSCLSTFLSVRYRRRLNASGAGGCCSGSWAPTQSTSSPPSAATATTAARRSPWWPNAARRCGGPPSARSTSRLSETRLHGMNRLLCFYHSLPSVLLTCNVSLQCKTGYWRSKLTINSYHSHDVISFILRRVAKQLQPPWDQFEVELKHSAPQRIYFVGRSLTCTEFDFTDLSDIYLKASGTLKDKQINPCSSLLSSQGDESTWSGGRRHPPFPNESVECCREKRVSTRPAVCASWRDVELPDSVFHLTQGNRWIKTSRVL